MEESGLSPITLRWVCDDGDAIFEIHSGNIQKLFLFLRIARDNWPLSGSTLDNFTSSDLWFSFRGVAPSAFNERSRNDPTPNECHLSPRFFPISICRLGVSVFPIFRWVSGWNSGQYCDQCSVISPTSSYWDANLERKLCLIKFSPSRPMDTYISLKNSASESPDVQGKIKSHSLMRQQTRQSLRIISWSWKSVAKLSKFLNLPGQNGVFMTFTSRCVCVCERFALDKFCWERTRE